MPKGRQRTNIAADAQSAIAAADAAIETPAAANAAEVSADMPDTTIAAADAAMQAAVDAAPAPEATADGTIELTPEAAAVLNLTAALAGTPETSPMHSVLTDALAAALAVQTAAEAARQRLTDRADEESAALAAAAAHNLSDAVVDAMLTAIAAKYAPAAPAPEAAPQREALGAEAAFRRQASDRTVAANAAAAIDTEAQARALDSIAAFDSDSGKLACTVNRRPNTRFSGMVALAPSSAGVANYADYDRLTRAIRAALLSVKGWQASDSDGQSVPEAKWLASRGRYILGSGVKSAVACFHSFAEIALYADGRFRFAYPSQAGVRFLRTDNAAWQAFVGSATAAVAPAAAAPQPLTPPTAPTPPQAFAPDALALPHGGVARTARCQHCNTRNIVGAGDCASCGSADWLLGDNA